MKRDKKITPKWLATYVLIINLNNLSPLSNNKALIRTDRIIFYLTLRKHIEVVNNSIIQVAIIANHVISKKRFNLKSIDFIFKIWKKLIKQQ